MSTVRIDGVDIYYRITGSGPAVVLTHGAWTNAETWAALAPILAQEYTVVVWDRRGHSRSRAREGGGGYRQDAADLVALVDRLADGPAHLVGNSSGGAVTLNAVAARPDLVCSAMVHEPAAFSLLEGFDDALLHSDRAGEAHVTELIRAGRHREAARYFVDEMGVGLPTWDELPPGVREAMVENAPTVPTDIEESYRRDSIDWAGLSRSDTPLLVTLGEESSPLLQDSTRRLPDRVRCDLAEMPATGHVPHRTHPVEYADRLAGFLSRSVPVT